MNDSSANTSEILIVAGSPENLKTLQVILTKEGYQVRSAIDGELALRSAALHPPDLILMDIRMPDMNGYEVCLRLKSDAALAEIPVIFISTLGDTEDKLRGFQVGGVDYINKPFQSEEILARIKTQVDVHRAKTELKTANEQLKASQAELELLNTKLETRITQRTEELQKAVDKTRLSQKEVTALLEAAKAIPLSRTFEEAARKIFDLCTELIGATSGYIALLSDDGLENEVLFLEAGGLPCDVNPELPMPIRGLREIAYKTGESAYENDFHNSKWMQFMPEGHVRLENVLFAPVNIKKETIGLIGIANKPGGFTKRDAKMANAFSDLASVALTYAGYQNEIRENEEQLNIIFDNTPAIMMLINENTEVIKMNKTGEAASEKSLKNTTGLRSGDILNCINSFQNPDGCGSGESCKSCLLRKTVEETFATDQDFYKIEAELTLKKKDTLSEHTVLISTCVVHSEPPKTVLVTIDDISEIKNMEKQLLQAQKMEAIGTLAGGIAHDFNNILFPIIGLSEMLMDDFPDNSVEYENIQQIYNAGVRGSDLVRHILSFSRQSENKMIPVRIQLILKEVLKFIRSTIPANINISQDIKTDCGLVHANPIQIHQIAMNLVTNAFHALEETGGTISIRLKEQLIDTKQSVPISLKMGRYAVLSISDTGSGIEPASMDRIFEPYFTTKEQGKGTGLGLAVVFGIVKEHHGDIKVSSEMGKGTTFDIYLPLMENPSETPRAQTDQKSETGDERIILIDDEKSIVGLEKQMLERLGYKVAGFSSAITALEAFKADPYGHDLILTDMSMPSMTGLELAKNVLQIRPDIPVILCTGFSDLLIQDAAKKIGVKGILKKPILKTEIAKMIRKVLK